MIINTTINTVLQEKNWLIESIGGKKSELIILSIITLEVTCE